jgi:2-deoxy-D-gluconate 3-dehydrogenase
MFEHGNTEAITSTGLLRKTRPMEPTLRLDGHTALVTGASRGLGQDIADTLQELGARVYGTSRTPEVAEEIAQRYGTRAVVLDVSDPVSVSTQLTALIAADPGIDLLVNNAGINLPRPAEEVDTPSWDSVFATNVRGTFLVSQWIGRHWISNSIAGRLCNISSQAGRVAIENRTAYSASKAAVDQLTRSLAFEWAPHGIRVNAVAPTFVRTELTESTLSNPEVAQRLLDQIPLGRFGEPQDISPSVAFLLGDYAGLITGHTLVIDGGYTIH